MKAQHTLPGHHKSVESFREHLRRVAPDFDCDLQLLGQAGPLGQSLDIGGRVLQNRFVTHPMEGWDAMPDGLPSEHTLRRWRLFGQSGAKLVWGGEAFAVQADGRANPHQLYLNPAVDVRSGLSALREQTREGHRALGEDPDSLYIGLQLTHSGRFARPEGPLAPKIAYHWPALDAKYGLPEDHPLLTDGELEAIAENYVKAAKLAQSVGFDFVDVKCCHGYLLHEMLGARRRPGIYGGSFENRTRFFRRIVDAIRSECPGLDIGVRISIADTYPYRANAETRIGELAPYDRSEPIDCGFGVSPEDPSQFDLTEPFEFLALLETMGIKLVNLSAGSPYYNPHFQRPAAYPPSDGYLPPEDPLLSVTRQLGLARACKAQFPNLVFVGTGYSYLQEYLPQVAQHEVGQGHVDLVGLGRMAIVYGDMVADVLAGRELERKRICRTFSDCTTAPRNGMISGCFPLDPYYKDMPEAAALKALKKKADR